MIGRLFKPAVSVALAGVTVTSGLPDERGQSGQGPRIVFSIARTMTPEPDTATVSVYGLARARRKAIEALYAETGRLAAEIKVGYDRVALDMFSGDVRELRGNARTGGDRPLQFTADDAGDALSEVLLPGLSSIGLTPEQMIDAALAAFAAPPNTPTSAGGTLIVKHPSVAAAIAGTTSAPSFYNVVAIGRARDLIDEAARILGVRWWIRDGQLFMARRGLPTDGLAVQLPPDRWLTEPSEDGDGLIRVATLLDPQLVPGRQVRILGWPFTGQTSVARIEQGTYAGDTEQPSPFSAALVCRRSDA